MKEGDQLDFYTGGIISSGPQEQEGVWQEEKNEAFRQRDVVDLVTMERNVRFQEDVTLATSWPVEPGCFAEVYWYQIQNGELNHL